MDPAVMRNAEAIRTLRTMVAESKGGTLHWYHGRQPGVVSTLSQLVGEFGVEELRVHTPCTDTRTTWRWEQWTNHPRLINVPRDPMPPCNQIEFDLAGQTYTIAFSIYGKLDTVPTHVVDTRYTIPARRPLEPVAEQSASV